MSRSRALLAALAAALLCQPAAAQLRPSMPTSSAARPQAQPQPDSPDYTNPNVGLVGRGLSTVPRGVSYPPINVINASPAAATPSYGMPAFGGGWGGVMPNSMGYGYALQGMADYTRASGQYWNDIEQARMSREKVRQEELSTQRDRLQFEMDYEKLRPTGAKMRDKARIDDLDWARKDPPNTQIWSGDTFNILLRSILTSSQPTSGPRISLEPNMIQGLNLRDKSARGNLSLIKDESKIDWPDALMEKPFDGDRDAFSRNYDKAVKSVQYGQPPDRTLTRDLRADLQRMDDRLVAMVGDLTPTEFIDGRRQIRELTDTVRAMSNRLTVQASSRDWRRNVRTVADLVNYMMKNGLEFGPARTASDFSAYSAAYFPIRNYERGLIGSTSSSSSSSSN